MSKFRSTSKLSMAPQGAFFDMADVGGGNSIQPGYLFLFINFVVEKISNFFNISAGQFSPCVGLPLLVVAAFSHAVGHVISLGAQEVVFGVAAFWVVTLMADTEPGWYRAVSTDVSLAVGELLVFFISMFTIPVRAKGASPLQTPFNSRSAGDVVKKLTRTTAPELGVGFLFKGAPTLQTRYGI